jgi:hypothetical protein
MCAAAATLDTATCLPVTIREIHQGLVDADDARLAIVLRSGCVRKSRCS